jgi:hypothetical protein
VKKIVSLFQRNYETDRLVRDEIVPGAEWVIAGEGVATRKYDGVCTMVRGGNLFKRYELKPGKNPPPNWEPADERDETTGKQMGWVPVRVGDPADRYMLEALAFTRESCAWEGDGTYEFVGPKAQGGIEGFDRHLLLRHGIARLPDAPRTFDALRAYLAEHNIEGIVWHHPDGRMVKIKGKDFGIMRTAEGAR